MGKTESTLDNQMMLMSARMPMNNSSSSGNFLLPKHRIISDRDSKNDLKLLQQDTTTDLQKESKKESKKGPSKERKNLKVNELSMQIEVQQS